jgi:putative ABC transport system permease protein
MTATQETVPAAGLVQPANALGDEPAAGLISPLEIIRIAWEGILRNKIRSLLTMLGVIIGVAAVIIMIGVSAGTEATIAEQIEGLGANLVFIQGSFGRGGPGQNSSTPALVYDDVATVANVPGVAGTSVEMSTNQAVKADGVTLTDMPLVGTTPDYPSVRDVPMDEGRFLNAQDLGRKAKW